MDVIEPKNIIDQAVKSVKWSALANFLPRMITPIATAIIAALLTPSDFGLVVISSFVLVLAQIVTGLGLSAAIVQRRTEIEAAASAAFWLNLILSVSMFCGLWFGAPLIARLYHAPQAELVIRVSGFSLILYALIGIPEALLQRALRFKELFRIRVASQITLSLVSVGLAIAGVGVWALVFGSLLGILVNAVGVWVVTHWKPTLNVKKETAGALLKFGVWVMVSGFQSWLFLYADNAILGFYQGSTQLGVYALGFNLSSFIPGLIISPLSAVAYPVFCEIQHDRERLGKYLLKMQVLALVVLAPLVLGACALASPAIQLLYGDKWPGLAYVIALLSLNGFGQLWSLTSDAYRAINRPDIWPKLAGLALIILIPSLFLAGPFGLETFTIVRMLAGFALPVMIILFGQRVVGISLKEQLTAFLPLMLTATLTLAVGYGMIVQLNPFSGMVGGLKLISVVLVSSLVYCGLLWRFHSKLWLELLALLRSSMGRVINDKTDS